MEEEIENKPKLNFKEYLNRNKKKILGVTSFIILIVFVIIIMNEIQKKQNIEISKDYNMAKILIEKESFNEAVNILENIINQNNIFYSPSALNLIIDNNLIKEKTKVLSYFDQIIFKVKLDQETKNLFIFKRILFIGDEIEENELISSLKPILNSDSLWKKTVIDYIKKYYLSRGELNKAKEFETTIIK